MSYSLSRGPLRATSVLRDCLGHHALLLVGTFPFLPCSREAGGQEPEHSRGRALSLPPLVPACSGLGLLSEGLFWAVPRPHG